MFKKYLYLRTLWSWKLWAFGYVWQRVTPEDRIQFPHKYDILTIGIGPARIQFMDWANRWPQREEKDDE